MIITAQEIHDVNSALGVILMTCEIVQDALWTEDQLEVYIEMIRQNAAKAHAITVKLEPYKQRG